jgi:4-phosphopantoate--beta-alanine ligase
MIKISAPKNHPRYLSLFYRDLLTWGVKEGITSLTGLTAHGRGETFDYLIGEKTQRFAVKAIEAAAALFLLSKHPVISVNGNTAILAGKELIKLTNLLGGNLEVNIFHASKERERKIKAYLIKCGAQKVLLPHKARIPGIESNRRMISSEGQLKSDVVFVPLEDGDRTAALEKMGKKVITVDLNPLSRTAQTATITIVDNIVRALPLLIEKIKTYQKYQKNQLKKILHTYDNQAILSSSLKFIGERLTDLSSHKR